EAVAGQNQFALGLVVNGEPEHAAQFGDAIRAHFFVEMDDDFSVGLGVEAMAAAFELRAQFGKIVDFTVVDDPGAPIFVENGLMPAGKINDGKTAHAKASAIGNVNALVVGTTVGDLVAHVAHESFCNVAFPCCADDSRDPTHGSSLTF